MKKKKGESGKRSKDDKRKGSDKDSFSAAINQNRPKQKKKTRRHHDDDNVEEPSRGGTGRTPGKKAKRTRSKLTVDETIADSTYSSSSASSTKKKRVKKGKSRYVDECVTAETATSRTQTTPKRKRTALLTAVSVTNTAADTVKTKDEMTTLAQDVLSPSEEEQLTIPNNVTTPMATMMKPGEMAAGVPVCHLAMATTAPTMATLGYPRLPKPVANAAGTVGMMAAPTAAETGNQGVPTSTAAFQGTVGVGNTPATRGFVFPPLQRTRFVFPPLPGTKSMATTGMAAAVAGGPATGGMAAAVAGGPVTGGMAGAVAGEPATGGMAAAVAGGPVTGGMAAAVARGPATGGMAAAVAGEPPTGGMAAAVAGEPATGAAGTNAAILDLTGAATPVKATRGPQRVVTLASKQAANVFVKTAVKTGIDGFRKEFAELKDVKVDHHGHVAFTANMERNRYKHVVCLDATRTVLHFRVPPCTDYIHANWVRAHDSDTTFIATQGPMDNTIEDFWRLCYQESVPTIVMLCNVFEDGKQKCAQYWPLAEGSCKKYGVLTVVNKKVVKDEKFIIFSLDLMAEPLNTPRPIQLIQMTSWPDRGVPANGVNVLRLLRKTKNGNPCLVHCSAGIGRTGTAITISVVLDRLFKGINVNLKELVSELRLMRAAFVQNEAQYVFIVSTVFEYIKTKIPGVHDSEIAAFQSDARKAAMQ